MNIKSRTNNADDLAWVHLIERRKQVELWQFSCLRQSYALELSPNIMEGVNPEGQLVMVQWSPSNDLQRVKIQCWAFKCMRRFYWRPFTRHR